MNLDEHDKALIAECVIHWGKIVERDPIERPGGEQCALCHWYGMTGENCVDEDGRRCPIYRATGYEGCDASPYGPALQEWKNDALFAVDSMRPRAGTLRREAMLEFLKTLHQQPEMADEYVAGWGQEYYDD